LRGESTYSLVLAVTRSDSLVGENGYFEMKRAPQRVWKLLLDVFQSFVRADCNAGSRTARDLITYNAIVNHDISTHNARPRGSLDRRLGPIKVLVLADIFTDGHYR